MDISQHHKIGAGMSLRIPLAFLSVCAFYSELFSHSIRSKAADQKIVITETDRLMTQVQNQMYALESSLRSLNITLIKEKKFTASKRKQIQAFISKLMGLINSIKSENLRNADIESCQVLIDFNFNVATLVNKERLSHFKTAQTFDVNQFIKSMQRKKGISGVEIIKKFAKTWHILGTIEQEGLGLTRLNRIARWVDNNIVAPAQRYSIPSRALDGLGTVFFVLYFWNKFNIPEHNIFYNAQNIDPLIKKEAPLKELFRITYRADETLGDMIRHKAPFAEFLLMALLKDYVTEYSNNFKPWFEKKFRVWMNKAKGGSYTKEADRIDEKVEKVRFKDIHGHEEIKRYFKFLVDYLEDSETHDRQGIRPSRGILCIGETRTGKTFCINAFLEEVNQMLISTGQIGKFRKITPSVLKIKIDGMERILQEAKAKAPCILFIDEIDLLDLQRTGENRTLSEFLTAMSDAVNSNDSRRQIFIIAATNCPETLDIALRQPGRFGKELRFEYPSFNDRLNFISTKVKEFILPEQESEFNFEKLAHYTAKQSYEAMNLFIKDAMMKAKIDNNGQLTQQHLEAALEEDILHIIASHSKDIPLNEQRILAAHFAGQAVALSLINGNMKLGTVTIKQVMTELEEKVMGSHLYDKTKNKEQKRFEYGKLFTYTEKDSINIQTKEEKLNQIKVHVAGFVAEELLLGSCGFSCHAEKDHAAALNIAKTLAFQGADESALPKHIIRTKYDEAISITNACTKEMKLLLEQHKSELERVMQALLTMQTIDRDTVEKIVQPVA